MAPRPAGNWSQPEGSAPAPCYAAHPMSLRAAFALLLALTLAACGQEGSAWHETDITGAMPALQFRMTRAHDAKAVTADAYLGKVAILYFGYTHCPDVCPATLANLSDVLQRLGPRARDVRVLFVTVDPARDTPSVLDAYAHAFAPQVDGLSGSADDLAALARRYRVAYSVAPASAGKPYTVMHSDAVFIFDRAGRARLVTTSTSDTAGMAEDVKRLLSS